MSDSREGWNCTTLGLPRGSEGIRGVGGVEPPLRQDGGGWETGDPTPRPSIERLDSVPREGPDVNRIGHWVKSTSFPPCVPLWSSTLDGPWDTHPLSIHALGVLLDPRHDFQFLDLRRSRDESTVVREQTRSQKRTYFTPGKLLYEKV